MKRRGMFRTMATVLLMALVAGCSGSGGQQPTASGGTGTQPAPEKKQFVVGWSTDTVAQPWRANLTDSIKTEWAKHSDVKLIMVEAQGKTEKQISDIEDLITQKVDLIMASPKEEKALTAVVAKAFKAGIPVVLADRGVEGKDFTTRVLVDHVEMGHKMADYVGKKLNGRGNVVIIEGVPGATTVVELQDGFMEGMKKYPDIKILASQPADYRRDKAMQVMENYLQAHEKIDVVVSHADEMTMGALIAAKNVNREKDIVWASVNSTMEFLKEIKEKNIVGASPLRSNTASVAVRLAYQILKGEGSSLPKVHWFPVLWIDETNVDKYYNPSAYSPDPWDPIAEGMEIRTTN